MRMRCVERVSTSATPAAGSLTARECAQTGDELTAARRGRKTAEKSSTTPEKVRRCVIAFDNASRRDDLKGRQIFIYFQSWRLFSLSYF